MQEKVDDVRKLLGTHFGENWTEQPKLLYFKNFFELFQNREPEGADIEDQDNILCEHVNEIDELVV